MKKVILVTGLVSAVIFGMAQNNINQYEYWFDSDFTNRVTTDVPPSQLFTLNSAVSTVNLENGLHTFHIRFRDDSLKYSSVVSRFFQKINQNIQGTNAITAYEYWFDGDYDNRVTQAVSPQAMFTLNTEIPASSLPNGLHTLHLRFQDIAGNWSSVTSRFFQKINPTQGNNQIVGFEYCFDGDYAGKVYQTVTPQTLYQLDTAISASQLAVGLHTYHIRFVDTGGNWSSTVSQFFQKIGQGTGIPNVVSSYRYWFDGDVNTMVNQTLNPPSNPLYLIDYLNLSQLDTGQHQINFQFRDTIGQWSAVVTDTFVKLGEPRLDFITPNQGGNTGDVTVFLNGTGFYNGTEVNFIKPGIDTLIVPDSAIVITNGERIQVTVDLRNKSIGNYDVVVKVPGDTIMTLIEAFEIVNGKDADPYVEINGFSVIRANQWQSYSIVCGNRGNVNATGVPLWIIIPQNIDYELDFPTARFPDTQTIDFDTVAYSFLTDTILDEEGNFKAIPIFIPVIPASQNLSLNIKLRSPVTQTFEISSWIGKPLYQSPPSQEAVNCYLDIVFLVAEESPAYGCVLGWIDFGWRPVINQVFYGEQVTFAHLMDNFIQTTIGCIPNENPVTLARRTLKVITESNKIIEGFQSVNCALTYLPQLASPKQDLSINTVTSFDPNDKIGPQGAGAGNYYNDQNTYTYSVHFENVDSATANTQNVLIIDTLDVDVFDFSTFEFGHFEIGDTILNVPPGRQYYQTLYNMVAAQNVVVKITATFNDTTGVASWLFESLDPQTLSSVANPFDGFLPPNQTAPEGEGAVHYSIKLKSNLPNNTEIKNKAHIYFDANPPLATQVWLNTLDNIKPHSQVNQLVAIQSDTLFNVSWNGIDTSSGVRDYDIYVSTNEGTFRLWLLNANFTSATFNGEVDSTYCFYSIAADSAGNVEAAPLLPDACTSIILTDVIEYQLEEVGKVSVYPNPANNFVTVFGENIQNPEVRIFLKDVLGRQWYVEKLKTMTQSFMTKIDVSLIPDGIYFIEIKAGGSSLIEKISVSKP
jgi:Secretion system C-terminal sorting domain